MFQTKNFIHYLSTFFITFFIQLAMFFLHTSGYGTLLHENQLNLVFMAINSVASISVFYYLKQRGIDSAESTTYFLIILSICYGLCSYAILQPKTLAQATIFALFPILYSFYNELNSKKEGIKFILLLAIFFCLNAITTIELFFILFTVLLVNVCFDRIQPFARILYFIATSLVAFSLSAIFSIPQLFDLSTINGDIIYPGFCEFHPLSVLLSRTIFGSVSSLALTTNNGANIYVGLLPLLFAFFYFANKQISPKSKGKMLVILFVFILSMNYSPVLYLFSIKSSAITQYNSISFVISFFILQIAHDGFLHLKTLNNRRMYIVSGLFAATMAIVLAITNKLFSQLAVTTCIVLVFAYIATCTTARKKEGFGSLLVILCVIELLTNTFLTSFAEFIPSTISNASAISKMQFNKHNKEFSSDEFTDNFVSSELSSTTDADLYNDFIDTYHDTEIFTTLDKLDTYCNLELGIDSSKYLDSNEKYNYLFHALGYKEDLLLYDSSISFEFDNTDTYEIIDQGHNIFQLIGTPKPDELEYVYVSYQVNGITSDAFILNNNDNGIIHLSSSSTDTCYICLPLSPYYGFNFHIGAYSLNENAYDELSNFLANANITTNQFNMLPYYLGLIITALSCTFFVLYYLTKRKGALPFTPYNLIANKCNNKVTRTIARWICDYNLYLIAFLVPFCSFVFYMIVFDIAPFGTATLWDGDGALSVFPYLYDTTKHMQKGTFSFSPNQGYGGSMYMLPLYYYVIALFVKADYFLVAYHWILSILMGLASVCMTFYIQHRITESREYTPNKYLALLPAFVYGLNAYLFSMHAYFMWFIPIALLPILLYAFEQLVYNKKVLLYTILLSLFMCTEIQISFYICIFLAICFLCTKHNGIKDFFLSGIRFGCCSLLAACNAFIYIAGMFSSKTQSGYAETDSIRPTFGFFGSYLDIFAHHLPFTQLESVSQDNTNIALYVTVIAFMLALLYLCNNSISLSKRIRRFIPLLIFYLSFNEQMSAYIINGLHYQTLVPNRHAFLVIFLLAVLAYDGLVTYKQNTRIELIFVGFICLALFGLCAIFTSQVSIICVLTSLIAIVVYEIILLVYRDKSSAIAQKILVMICGISLFINGLYNNSLYNFYGMSLFGDYQAIEAYIDNELHLDNDAYRVNFTSTPLANAGMVYGVSSTDLFQSCLPNDVLSYHSLYGGTTGTNYTRSSYSATPVNNSLFSMKYLFYPVTSTVEDRDLGNYNYIGYQNNYYVLENTHAAPLMYTVPLDTKDFRSIPYSPIDINELVSCIQPESDDIYQLQYISYTPDYEDIQNTYCFFDSNHSKITPSDAVILHDNTSDPTTRSDDYYVKINITPAQSGYAYFYAGEYIPIGYLDANCDYSFDIYGPKLIEYDHYIFFTIDEAVANHLYEYLDTHQLNDVKIEKNTLSGISNSDTECYTQIMIPYHSNWKAYVDGREVPIETNSSSIMYVKTPSGKHTIEVKYCFPFSYVTIVSIAGWFTTLILSIILLIINKRKKS